MPFCTLMDSARYHLEEGKTVISLLDEGLVNHENDWSPPLTLRIHPFGDRLFHGIKIPFSKKRKKKNSSFLIFSNRQALNRALRDVQRGHQPTRKTYKRKNSEDGITEVKSISEMFAHSVDLPGGVKFVKEISDSSEAFSSEEVDFSPSLSHHAKICSPDAPSVIVVGDDRRIDANELNVSIVSMLMSLEKNHTNDIYGTILLNELHSWLLRSYGKGVSEECSPELHRYRSELKTWLSISYKQSAWSAAPPPPPPPIEHLCCCRFEWMLLKESLGEVKEDPLGGRTLDELVKMTKDSRTKSKRKGSVSAGGSEWNGTMVGSKRGSSAMSRLDPKSSKEAILEARHDDIVRRVRHNTFIVSLNGKILELKRQKLNDIISESCHKAFSRSISNANEIQVMADTTFKSPMDHIALAIAGRYLFIHTSTMTSHGPGCLIIMTRGQFYNATEINLERPKRLHTDRTRSGNLEDQVSKESFESNTSKNVTLSHEMETFTNHFSVDLLHLMSSSKWNSADSASSLRVHNRISTKITSTKLMETMTVEDECIPERSNLGPKKQVDQPSNPQDATPLQDVLYCTGDLTTTFSDLKVFIVLGYRSHLFGKPCALGHKIWKCRNNSIEDVAQAASRSGSSDISHHVVVTRLRVNKFWPIYNGPPAKDTKPNVSGKQVTPLFKARAPEDSTGTQFRSSIHQKFNRKFHRTQSTINQMINQ
eukprot:GHVH01016206.1.p1 GENE.GHVH01016206.1~~GHVH01016206.1.p1  ORF type:complete len:708 (+),score=87.14 GHVH01016206.1:1222-3345(+)